MNKNVATYLNDHLAGSVAALELLEHLKGRYHGDPLADFFAELYREIKADQDVLRNLLGAAARRESAFRKMIAWLGEKLVRPKFQLAGEQPGGLGLAQALEALLLGIRGKELLWRGLAIAAPRDARGLDLVRLQRGAIDQQTRLEEKRLAAAREAFK